MTRCVRSGGSAKIDPSLIRGPVSLTDQNRPEKSLDPYPVPYPAQVRLKQARMGFSGGPPVDEAFQPAYIGAARTAFFIRMASNPCPSCWGAAPVGKSAAVRPEGGR